MARKRKNHTIASFAGATALITGASSGIGAEFAVRLAERGAHLVLVARSLETLEATAVELRSRYGVQVTPIRLDLSQAGAPQELAERLEASGIVVDVLVNNAGIAGGGPVSAADPEALAAMISTNIGAVVGITARLLPGMLARRRGVIVNVASTGAFQPAPYRAVYSASKAFVLSFTQALWAENANSGVRVLAVSPGPTETPMNSGAARGKRTPRQVVETTLKALDGTASSVVDGAANAFFARVFSKRFPERLVLRVGERVMRPKP